MDHQDDLDRANADFWAELCGTQLARSLGITEITPAALERFDRAYLDLYPYLSRYVTREPLEGRDVLEIGLGYGTLSQLLAASGARYHGADIAPSPVEVVRERLRLLHDDPGDRVLVASALALPWPDRAFDFVYSIGCLHHTGDLERAVEEVHRVLRPGGAAIVMLYNRHSFRRLSHRLRGRSDETSMRALYDADSSGAAAPHTDYVSTAEARRLFGDFSHVRIRMENFDDYAVNLLRWSFLLPRGPLLATVAHVLGLDLYIRAQK